MTPKFHTLTISDIRKETEDTVSIAFEIDENIQKDYAFKPGQYLTLKASIDGEDTRRSYSLCSTPHENEWRVAVKQIEKGKFSTYANNQLEVGQFMEVMTPTGNFHANIDYNNQKSYVLIAAGSGITPIFSIAKTVLKEEPQSNVTIFYGNKGFSSIIFREEIEALKNAYMERLRVVHILSRESLGNKIQKGRIDAAKIEDLYNAFLDESTVDEVFVCGPEEMIHSVKNFFHAKGISDKNVHFELFSTSSVKNTSVKIENEEPSFASIVKVIIDGDLIEVAMESNGESILDAATKAGGDLPYACKGGVCCTCKAKILEGTAKMDINYALEPDEVENGYILTCQAHPTSSTLTVSFDD
ncbi:MAG: phenylacetate-CoA oxygenase/reductase subunit PaaK [Flavobacteriia bacterium]|nr:phenylacetate-CoA oxygenase/reductase subunit PaaK [Flavobacteriia bacterium]